MALKKNISTDIYDIAFKLWARSTFYLEPRMTWIQLNYDDCPIRATIICTHDLFLGWLAQQAHFFLNDI